MRMVSRFLVLVMTLELMRHAALAQSPIIAIGPPSFQSTNFPSLETTILDRLALGGDPDPADLATLSHLAVLESISMLADIQYDMANTPLGYQLEGQVKQLWDSAATFEESVSANPVNAQTLAGVQPVFNNMQSAYRDIESTLGGSAGLSYRAANRLAGITRLTDATGTLMRAIESDILASAPIPDQPGRGADSLGSQTRLLANSITVMIDNVKASKHTGSEWGVVKRDLEELFALVQNLQKPIAARASGKEIESALHAVRRRMWRVEARIARLGWPADLERQWRGVRERLNQVSDALGVPRVLDLPTNAPPKEASTTGPTPKPPARVYRGPK